MNTTTDLSTWTPQQIDSALYDIYQETARARQLRDWAWDRVATEVKNYLNLTFRDTLSSQVQRDTLSELDESRKVIDQLVVAGPSADREAWSQAYRASKVLAEFDKAEAAETVVENLVLDTQPYDEEFDRRGGWTRAFLVNNSNGHVHRSMHCSSCFPSTSYHWVTDLSDHDESEIVEQAGERACTVCYPTAPVEVLSRPTSLFTPDELEKQRAKAEREAKRAARAAAEITVPGYYGFNSKPVNKVFKTARAATNDIAGNLTSLAWYGSTHPDAWKWATDIESVRATLEAKGVEYDFDKALAAARKKVTREGGTVQY